MPATGTARAPQGVLWALAAVVILPGAGCGRDVAGSNGDPPIPEVVPYAEGIRIAWDYRTRQRLFDGPASYPRMIGLDNGELLVSVESRGGSHVLISQDDGSTWSAPIEVASPSNGVIAAVPSLLQLEDGTVLLAYNTRPPADNVDTSRRFGLKLAASADRGRTWDFRATVFEGGHTPAEGVWEPAMIQRGTGELLLFFANEAPYTFSDEQEISLVRSSDAGSTWSEPTRVSYRQGHRDGMPVPLPLDDSGVMAVAIEDNGLVPGPFKPVIIRLPPTGFLEGEYVDGDSPRRHPALAPAERLPVFAYGGAPYLTRFPGGPALLSFQRNDGAPTWEGTTMTVAIGTDSASEFSRSSHPFPVPDDRWALWNSIFVKDANTVTALSSTNAFNAAHQELYIIDGHRVSEPVIHPGAVTVDGDAGDAGWDQDTDLFVGAYSPKVVRTWLAWDPEHLYVRFDVLESSVVDPVAPSADDDAVLLSIATGNLVENKPVNGAFKLRVEAGGGAQLFEGSGGAWQAVEAPGVEVAASDPVETSEGVVGVEYTVEVGIPWEVVGGRPTVGMPWGLDVGLVNREVSGAVTREWVAGTTADRPATWLKAVLAD